MGWLRSKCDSWKRGKLIRTKRVNRIIINNKPGAIIIILTLVLVTVNIVYAVFLWQSNKIIRNSTRPILQPTEQNPSKYLLVNYGTGPAIIDTFKVDYKDKPIEQNFFFEDAWLEVIKQMGISNASIVNGCLGGTPIRGLIIKGLDETVLLSYSSHSSCPEGDRKKFNENRKFILLHIEYHSIYGEVFKYPLKTWRVNFSDKTVIENTAP